MKSVTRQCRLQGFSGVSSFEKKKGGQSKHPNATWQEKQEWDVSPLPIAQPVEPWIHTWLKKMWNCSVIRHRADKLRHVGKNEKEKKIKNLKLHTESTLSIMDYFSGALPTFRKQLYLLLLFRQTDEILNASETSECCRRVSSANLECVCARTQSCGWQPFPILLSVWHKRSHGQWNRAERKFHNWNRSTVPRQVEETLVGVARKSLIPLGTSQSTCVQFWLRPNTSFRQVHMPLC